MEPKAEKRAFEYAFGGPLGVLGIMLALPLAINVMILFGICYNEDGFAGILERLNGFFDDCWTALWCLLGWFLFQAVLYLSPLGKDIVGLPLSTGQRLKYRCNGFHAFVVTAGVALIAQFVLGLQLYRLFEIIWPMASVACGLCFALSVYLYIRALFRRTDELAQHGMSGNHIYDFFMGRELNPRTGKFDWKYFCELRPGLIGWIMLELSMVAFEYHTTGSCSLPLVLLTAFHAWYVGDALWNEPALLSTKDIIEEGFGFMLVFGDMAWVPFFYSSQTLYLVSARPDVPWLLVFISIVLHLVGYVIFRQSNLQKNLFRNSPNDPRVKAWKTIPTSVLGKNLLCDGWWSFVRHPNYLGDLLLAMSWTLMCGLDSFYPFIYCGYFFALLIHREIRDEEVCSKKYGDAWKEFRTRVPYRIFPFVF
ncbi:hypothetical protein RvY_01270 [Ramazzottius varieornatus]|uniref:Delta(14)-sterol reductase n=1 Tax=Ramazzottius varieornatus TaxID=947166 RepID=A0A1D1UJA8_RAMVA|nr:hypothetical protein RvY_01270 [Ramazzottius varieornatus]